ncbi:phosphoribosylaminoimidazolesuccinocarboxamide synthase [Bythopirellula goksoeyrii]|uniref:Phosphoribosylaminoimidazole-succinocarboxamide synthase n=1 Tax=Bythopirellula goksoeyrii TaxID=1400387 RepID=A0A5B9Q277_9BACT|nr:phosphoribosylaminoimidazolesuccinocarboxamide synthase [Bythopirellula goksoeyrii]QEG33084.1 Phosphoribosylaminoimidazole-succinocarboxamide synthase [Bythopirellula goksoeyrii]
MTSPLLQTELSGLPVTRGKVRDVYDLGENLLLVSTDRISAFDWVLPTGIPDKGRVLTQLSNFWFKHLNIPNHLLETEVEAMNLPADSDLESLSGRTILVRKTEVVPIECVVRGFISGSAWQEYYNTGKVCGIELPTGLEESARLPSMIFSPATKAAKGEHDENITFAEMCDRVGVDLADRLRHLSIETYQQGAAHAHEKGIIVADTKFEFGVVGGEIILVDEVLTPDSSRFWPADLYEPGHAQPSFDKQFVRDWLSESGWDKDSPPPELPENVVARTREKYIEAYERITGEPFAWK